jgi:two-component system response regulator CpxR
MNMALGEGGCVLVVDDEEDIRETLREVVEMGGCEALVAANGADALEVLATHRPCLVILDLLMPVMSGEEMLAAMRERPELAGLSVVISTSAPERAPAGVQVLRKPLNLQALWDLMRRTCACGAPPL